MKVSRECITNQKMPFLKLRIFMNTDLELDHKSFRKDSKSLQRCSDLNFVLKMA